MKCNCLISLMFALLAVASPGLAGDSPCEFNMTCGNVASILIEKSDTAWSKDGEPTAVHEVYVCAVFLKDRKAKRLENTVRNCNDTHYIVRSGSHVIARARTSAIPGGECFTFFEETLKALLVKVHQICPEAPIEYGPKMKKELGTQ